MPKASWSATKRRGIVPGEEKAEKARGADSKKPAQRGHSRLDR